MLADVEGDIDDLPPLEEVGFEGLLDGATALGTCMVCFDEGSMLRLECHHTICEQCLDKQLSTGWPGTRMTFGYLHCGVCRGPLAHGSLQETLAKHRELRREVTEVAVRQYCADGWPEHLCETLGRSATEDEVQSFAEAEMAVYRCFECHQPYCAGRAECIQAAEQELSPRQLRCATCKWSAELPLEPRCQEHGHRSAIFKCDSCCDIAVWICASNHYCERCHREAGVSKHYPCPGPGLCPRGRPHPPNMPALFGSGEAVPGFVIGCAACLGCVDLNEASVQGSVAGSDYGGDDYIHEDELVPFSDDCSSAKHSRERARATSSLRAAARRSRIAAKMERLAQKSSGRRGGWGRRVRGGRHKVPTISWFEDCCQGTE